MKDHEISMLDLILGEIKTIKTLLTGNGEPERGIIVRLDRIETKQKRISKAAGLVLGILATVIGAILAAGLTELLIY